jgi:putative transposase
VHTIERLLHYSENANATKVDWEQQSVRMSTVSGRQTIRFVVLDYCAHYAGYPVASADLITRDRVWWLHVVVTIVS